MIHPLKPLAFCSAITDRAFKYKRVYRDEYLAIAARVCEKYSRSQSTLEAMERNAGYGYFCNGAWEIGGLDVFEMRFSELPHCTLFGDAKNYQPSTDNPYSLFWCGRKSFNVPESALFCECCGKYGDGKTIKIRSDIYDWERDIERKQGWRGSKYLTCQSCYNKIKGLLKRMDAYNATKATLTNLRVEIKNG